MTRARAGTVNEMGTTTRGVTVWARDRASEAFDDPSRGDASWFTLLSADLTPSEAMSAGIMELPPRGAGLAAHRHAPPEIYHVLTGDGEVVIDGAASAVSTGATVFIPGDAEHALRNTGSATLRVFYVFPTDRFSDVTYRFGAG